MDTPIYDRTMTEHFARLDHDVEKQEALIALMELDERITLRDAPAVSA